MGAVASAGCWALLRPEIENRTKKGRADCGACHKTFPPILFFYNSIDFHQRGFCGINDALDVVKTLHGDSIFSTSL